MTNQYDLEGMMKQKGEVIYLKGEVTVIEGTELKAAISEFKEKLSEITDQTIAIRKYDLEGSIFILDDMKIEMMETPRADNVPHTSYLVSKNSIDSIAGKYFGNSSIDISRSTVDLSGKMTPELIREIAQDSKNIAIKEVMFELRYKR